MTAALADPQPSRRINPVVQRVAMALGETAPQPLAHIRRLVMTTGEERVLRLLGQAQDVERQGSLLRADGSRRLLGGVFFKLAKEQATGGSSEKRAADPLEDSALRGDGSAPSA